MNVWLYIILAFVSVLTTLTLALRMISWRTLIKYHWAADIVFTIALVILFSGTVTGTIIAVISGLIFSIILTVGKRLTPPIKLEPKRKLG